MATDRSEALDLARGLAALLVMFGHLRSIFFVPFTELEDKGTLNKLFYFLTGYGHECVMIFFVLSGYFVGAAYHRRFDESRVLRHTINYGVNRMVRLWVVLIPALMLTALLDWIGLSLTSDKGIYTNPDHFQFIHPSNDRSLLAFLGNVFFVQTIFVPTFGTNTPLWSLANELWYYLLFPASYLLFVKTVGGAAKAGLLMFVCLILAWLASINLELAGGFFIWLIGFGAYLTKWKPNLLFRTLMVGSFLLAFALSRLELPPLSEVLMLGIATGVLIVAVRDVTLGVFAGVAVFFSQISYTLYVVHLPLIIFFSATLLSGVKLAGGAVGIGAFTIMCLVLIGISQGCYYLFERRTDDVRKVVKRVLRG